MSLMDGQTDETRFEAHREFFREILLRIHQVMGEKFGLKSTTVRPMMSDGSRLSIPIRIEGVDMSGQKVRFFGKIIGSSNLMTARTIQFFKNVYLRMNSMDPL
ncbi:MAG: hypothetical protein LUQ14_03280, partial [Methanomassiliicoccales archaeon]|nr:hypothetical protein [Methanomassiliicoccales archaeon]